MSHAGPIEFDQDVVAQVALQVSELCGRYRLLAAVERNALEQIIGQRHLDRVAQLVAEQALAHRRREVVAKASVVPANVAMLSAIGAVSGAGFEPQEPTEQPEQAAARRAL